nr:Chain B, Pon peptide from Partner of numb [Drosophila melanogaster]5YI7_D Chain D, Pon peptide from Partner of numb [Drosophila melanogaster]
QQKLPTNPFEVLRQPPKKKKREHACFENPGLNLE